MACRRAHGELDLLARNLAWLNAEPLASDRWGRLDAVAKRFEIAFEATWKTFKIAIEYGGDEVYGPREAITIAGDRGWISAREVWAGYLQARNAGTHEYFSLDPEEYARIAGEFLPDARSALQRMGAHLDGLRSPLNRTDI